MDVLTKLTEIVKQHQIKETTTFLSDFDPVFQQVEQYIKANPSRIVHGTLAIITLLKHTSTPNTTSPIKILQTNFTPNQIYYEIYSPDARQDAISLANQLFLDNQSLVEARKNWHSQYTVSTNTKIVATFTQVPEALVTRIPHQIINDIPYASPEMLKIPILLAYTNPRYQIDRWETTLLLDNLLDTNYPIPHPKSSDQQPKKQSAYLQKTFDFIQKNKNHLIIIGNLAYQLLLKKSRYPNPFLPSITSYEVMAKEPHSIIAKLKTHFAPTPLTIKENVSILKFHNKKYAIFIDKVKLIDIYDIHNQCIQTITLHSQPSLTLANYHTILLYLYLGIWTSYKISITSTTTSERLRERLQLMIYHLSKARELYLNKNKITGLNSTSQDLFNIFQIKCQGMQKNIERNARIRKWNGKEKDHLLGIRSYKPELYKNEHGSLLS